MLEGATKQAEARVGAATSNVSGLSVNDVVNGIGEAINDKRATLQANWNNNAVQLQSQKDTAVAQEIGRIQQVPAPYSPNPMGMIASIAGSVFKGASVPGSSRVLRDQYR